MNASVTYYGKTQDTIHLQQDPDADAAKSSVQAALAILEQRMNAHERKDHHTNPTVPMDEQKFREALAAPAAYIKSKKNRTDCRALPSRAQWLAVERWSELLQDLNETSLGDER